MILLAKRYRHDDGSLVAIDAVREEAARCCDETAKMERGERGVLLTPDVHGLGAEFTDAAFGVACEVALVVGAAIRSTGTRARPDFFWSTAATLLRNGWKLHEAREGTGMTARRLTAKKPPTAAELGQMLPLTGADDRELLAIRRPAMTLAAMSLTAEVRDALDTIVLEHKHAKELAEHGVAPAWRVLFVGVPGTGKTSAAGALAAAIGVPLVTIGNILAQWMGASERNIRKVFERAAEVPSVYLVDEIDAIGSMRGGGEGGFASADKEYNNLLTSMLSCMDLHAGPGIVIGATNRVDVVDPALRRRFDVELEFPLPDHAQALALARAILAEDGDPELALGPLANKSHADVARLARTERKRRVMAAIVARAAKPPRARKPRAPVPATPGTETNQPLPAPEPVTPGTTPRVPLPTNRDATHRPAPGPATPVTDTSSSPPREQRALPL